MASGSQVRLINVIVSANMILVINKNEAVLHQSCVSSFLSLCVKSLINVCMLMSAASQLSKGCSLSDCDVIPVSPLKVL